MSLDINIPSPPRIAKSFTQTAHGFVVGNVVIRKADNTWFLARSTDSVAGRAIGFVSAVADVNNFTLVFQGYVTTGVPAGTAGDVYYVDHVTGGAITTTPDLRHAIPVLQIIESGASAIVMLGIDTKRISQWLFGDVTLTLASGTTRYCFLWGSTGTPQATESLRQTPAMMGTYSLFTINTVTSQPASGSLVLTTRLNGSDSSINLTIAAGSAAGIFEDLVNVITVTVNNDFLSYRLVNNATANSTIVVSSRILYNSH